MGTYKSYILGFVLSILLTLAAYFIVVNRLLTGWDLMLVVAILALIQFCVQLIFFLHLDHEKGPRWNFTVFLSTIGVVLIVIIGSLWIMNNLNYHMPTEDEIFQSEAIQK
jgi:cytochrome o ubiquinol oxidase operon protein cyoD